MKDYQTKKGRLTKKDYSADFRLADNDDFFGYSEQAGEYTFTEMLIGGLALAGLFFGITYLFLTITPNI